MFEGTKPIGKIGKVKRFVIKRISINPIPAELANFGRHVLP